MRLLDKGKEAARFPRDIRVSFPPAPPINYCWNYHASNTFATRSKARYAFLARLFEEAPRLRLINRSRICSAFWATALTLSPSASGSHGSIRPDRGWNRPEAVAATRTLSPGKLRCSRKSAPLFPARTRYLAHRRMALLKGQY